jgi:hypothetical protein
MTRGITLRPVLFKTVPPYLRLSNKMQLENPLPALGAEVFQISEFFRF